MRRILERAIPQARCELDHRNPFELLVATILSAQSTDAGVNRATPELFRRWPTPEALGHADAPDVEAVVHSTGFFRQKTRAIVGASRMLVERHGGSVPRAMADLLELPGVGRKTAAVVQGVAFGAAEGFPVDTHVFRVVRRLGLSRASTPEGVERDLMAAFPARAWVGLSLRLVLYGRYLCTARNPACADCPLNELCPSVQAPASGNVRSRVERARRRIPRTGAAARVPRGRSG